MSDKFQDSQPGREDNTAKFKLLLLDFLKSRLKTWKYEECTMTFGGEDNIFPCKWLKSKLYIADLATLTGLSLNWWFDTICTRSSGTWYMKRDMISGTFCTCYMNRGMPSRTFWTCYMKRDMTSGTFCTCFMKRDMTSGTICTCLWKGTWLLGQSVPDI